MNFSANKPCAVKIGTGKINAITGKSWESRSISITKDTQNYCPLPQQPWLDGINAGNGFLRQFVAMPLGKGYTVEHQVKSMQKEKEKKLKSTEEEGDSSMADPDDKGPGNGNDEKE